MSEDGFVLRGTCPNATVTGAQGFATTFKGTFVFTRFYNTTGRKGWLLGTFAVGMIRDTVAAMTAETNATMVAVMIT